MRQDCSRSMSLINTYWQHGDHLGSASWVTDTNGVGYQHLQYMPWGEQWVDQRKSGYTYNTRYTFSGKERDEETGYSYFGARYYHPTLSIWLSVDPMADKYPSLSPYVYCANNPVRLVDPDGREIVIKDANGLSYTYAYGQQCSSTDKNVQDAWENLNKMYETKVGRIVIEEMIEESAPTFIFTNESLKNDGTGRFKKDGKGGGTMYMAGNMKEAGYMSHELFHGYQEMKGQGGLSIHNEVEANLFAMLTTQFTVPLQPRNDPNLTTTYGKSYKAFFMNEVTESNFDQHFNALRKGFISNSRGNYNGDYSKFPSGENNESLLKRFFK